MEKRIGIYRGSFLDLILELSKNKKFKQLCLFSDIAIRTREPEEFVLRFFAFLNNYKNFNANKINKFLDNYLESVNKDKNFDREKMQSEFLSMLDFIEQHFSQGFRQGKNYNKTTTRIKFESLAVGIALALRIQKYIIPQSKNWINSQEFKKYTSGNGSSSKVKVIQRIEYVRDRILGEA
jgi:hypothetical protein